MAERISASQLIDDLTAVIRDAESLLRATAAQTGDKVEEIRARAEESVRHGERTAGGRRRAGARACPRVGRRCRRSTCAATRGKPSASRPASGSCSASS